MKLVLLVCVSFIVLRSMAKPISKNTKYSSVWVVKIEGGEETAQRIARDFGYIYQGQLGTFRDYYELKKVDHPEVSVLDSNHLTRSLQDLPEVKWARQQKLIKRISDDLWRYTEEAEDETPMNMLSDTAKEKSEESIGSNIYEYLRFPYSMKNFLMSYNQGDIKKLGSISTRPAPASQLNTYTGATENIGLLSRKVSAYALQFNDEYWKRQWYMQDYRTSDVPVMDINVVPVYKMGYTGKGVTVAVVDDGIFHNHPDLVNLDVDLSFDYCNNLPGCRPKVKYLWGSHGTSCAGVIGMTANNHLCGVGIAYNAKIVGIRSICKTRMVEANIAKEQTHKLDVIDIYSNSWSFPTKGYDIYYLDDLEKLAYIKGTYEGRNGKGAIYVHSAGNFKAFGDNCGYDCNINQPYVITIAAASQWGKTTTYSERCPAIMATAYSRSSGNDGVVSIDTSKGCIRSFDGTSAACPQGSAVVALTLEANSKLTYRDVMHLITMSAEVAPLANNDDTWYKNARGFWVSNDFGFGMLNAENMVKLAESWEIVPSKHICTVTLSFTSPLVLGMEEDVIVPFHTTACKDSKGNEVNYLEHIEIVSTIHFPYRGHIMLYIESPSGTKTQLLQSRYKDEDTYGLDEWSVMSTHNWGENPVGTWKITVKISKSSKLRYKGTVNGFTVTFHGTADEPAHYRKKRQYAAFRLPDGQTSETT